MIIGDNFAIGHIPKTGGDALHQWCSVSGVACLIDPLNVPMKHASFSQRDAGGKPFRALSMRHIDDWTVSYLRELRGHGIRDYWGIAGDPLRPEIAVSHSFADFCVSAARGTTHPTHWLRCGDTLLADLLSFLREAGHDPDESAMRSRAVKRPTDPRVDPAEFFTAAQRRRLRELNPQWMLAEWQAFGCIHRPMISAWELEQLSPIIEQHGRPRVIVEIGSYSGASLGWLADHAAASPTIVSISLATAQMPRDREASVMLTSRIESLRAAGAEAVQLPLDSGDAATAGRLKEILAGRTIDLLFLDGDHHPWGVARDVQLYVPLVRGLVVMHDCGAGLREPAQRDNLLGPHAMFRWLASRHRSILIQDDVGLGVIFVK